MGTFSFTTDFNLLAQVVRLRPDTPFRFQGTFWDRDRVRSIEAPNVELEERREASVEVLERFLEGVDVGLCPYVRSKWTAHAAPGRLLAFLSAGLPVVTTSFSEEALEGFRDLAGVFVADSPREFSSAISRAAEAGRDPEVIRGLVEASRPHLPDALAGRLESILRISLRDH
jgi:hypothetical protein